MKIRLKPLREQTMVITGATSGIGLALARKAAARGSRLVLAARNDDSLDELVEEIRAGGGEAVAVVADVGNEAEVRRIADTAVERFGGFDTWVNNAGISIYGALQEVSLADQRRLFDTNYWGVVHGSLIAAAHLQRSGGGALINVGSVLSDRAMPLQGAYSASKHAVKGFTDALRMELEQDGAPVSVSLIKPSALDTPHKDHARNYLPVAPRNPPPVYAAGLAADAVLHAAEHPIRDLVVGGGGRLLALAGNMVPRFTDRLMENRFSRMQRTDRPALPRSHNSLYNPNNDGAEHSDYPMVLQRSLYTEAAKRPAATAVLTLGAGLALWWLLGDERRR
jgi:short-subunit dehydrogenase